MRDRLIYILKHNKLIQKLYVVIMSFVFKVWAVSYTHLTLPTSNHV